jgi:hypothetical protein
MGESKRQFTLLLNNADIARLQEMARQFGYLHHRGHGAGTAGHVSEFIQAIARGELTVERPKEPDEWISPV